MLISSEGGVIEDTDEGGRTRKSRPSAALDADSSEKKGLESRNRES